MQILDAIRYIKKIPDTTIEAACKRLLVIIKNLPEKDQSTMVRLALKYPPAARALLGTILEQTQASGLTNPLFKSLNPITKHKLTGATKALSTTEKWNIV